MSKTPELPELFNILQYNIKIYKIGLRTDRNKNVFVYINNERNDFNVKPGFREIVKLFLTKFYKILKNTTVSSIEKYWTFEKSNKDYMYVKLNKKGYKKYFNIDVLSDNYSFRELTKGFDKKNLVNALNIEEYIPVFKGDIGQGSEFKKIARSFNKINNVDRGLRTILYKKSPKSNIIHSINISSNPTAKELVNKLEQINQHFILDMFEREVFGHVVTMKSNRTINERKNSLRFFIYKIFKPVELRLRSKKINLFN